MNNRETFLMSDLMYKKVRERVKKNFKSKGDYYRYLVMNDLNCDESGNDINKI